MSAIRYALVLLLLPWAADAHLLWGPQPGGGATPQLVVTNTCTGAVATTATTSITCTFTHTYHLDSIIAFIPYCNSSGCTTSDVPVAISGVSMQSGGTCQRVTGTRINVTRMGDDGETWLCAGIGGATGNDIMTVTWPSSTIFGGIYAVELYGATGTFEGGNFSASPSVSNISVSTTSSVGANDFVAAIANSGGGTKNLGTCTPSPCVLDINANSNTTIVEHQLMGATAGIATDGFISATDKASAMIAALPRSINPPISPASDIVFTPALVTMNDTSAQNTTVAQVAPKTTGNVYFTGTTAVASCTPTPQCTGLFALSGPANAPTVITTRALTTADDGSYTVTISATE